MHQYIVQNTIIVPRTLSIIVDKAALPIAAILQNNHYQGKSTQTINTSNNSRIWQPLLIYQI